MTYKFEKPYEKFEILDLTSREGTQRLVDLVLAEPLHPPSPAAHALLDTIARSGSCQCVVVEHGYIDSDYSRSFQKFYSRAYQEYGRYCLRLHLFGSIVTSRTLRNLERPRFRNSYLGYSVLRPLRERKVGRTVVEPVLADPQADFALTMSDFPVNLAGSELTVKGAPFIEQDGNVAVCASCAIWMSTKMAGDRFGLPTSTTSEITEQAMKLPAE